MHKKNSMNSGKGTMIKFVALLLLRVFVSGDVEVRCMEKEREALLSFKNGLIDKYDILSTWRSDECCKWYGVGCSNTTGQVISLKLNAADFDGVLRGKVTSSLLELHHLTYLDLSNNDFGGYQIPEFIGSMKQLQHLYLSSSVFSGTVPPHIGNLTNLRSLGLSHNSLRTENLDWLFSLSSLRYLLLSDNQISGVLHHLSSTSIQVLDVSSNNISGPIPSLPPTIGALQLSHNMFSGPISSLCDISHDSLHFIDLSNNQLSGEVPNCWGKTPYVNFLNLANNSFSGEIPHSLGSLRLAALQLRKNNLSGELPFTLRLCRGLNLIDVGGNKLTGYIPAWIGESYPFLRFLNFGSNRFYGSIPSGICNLTSIKILDLSRNNLSGKIPDCFNNFTSLAHKNTTNMNFGLGYTYSYNSQLPNNILDDVYSEYSTVQWKGQELEYRKTLSLLTLIDFSSNSLIGSIPQSFSNMRELISLNLSRNCLTGNIIPDIGQMEMLECLDLSNNQLYGEIPKSLENLTFLAFLDLSNNNLYGKIPSSTQLQTFNVSSYEGNNGLCGRPMAPCSEHGLRPPTTTNGEKDEDNGFWRLSFMQEFIISLAVGGILGFWGVVGSLILKKSWRYAYFKLLDDIEDWLYVRVAIFLFKWRRS